MSSEILGTDLFGNPVRPARSGPGRPPVEWDQSTSSRVLLCFVRGLGVAETAKMVEMSTPTLRKVYFSECAMRTTAYQRMQLRQLERLNVQAEAGNVAAEKELAKRIDELRMRDASEKFAKPASRKPKAEKIGKKEQRLREAQMAGAGDEDWADLLPGGASQSAH